MDQIMTDSKLLDRIIDRAVKEGQFYEYVEPLALRTVEEMNWPKIRIVEGETSKWADARALNFMALALYDPRWTFQTLRAEAPNNGDAIMDEMDDTIVNGTQPEVDPTGKRVGAIRTKGFIREVGKIAGLMSAFDREENYHYRLFTSLVRCEVTMHMGTNPLGIANEFYVHKRGPALLKEPKSTDDGESEPEVDMNSAADW